MILVTGGTGLVGSHLLHALLAKGQKVRATKRPTSQLSDVKSAFSFYDENHQNWIEKIEWVDADLLNPAEVDELFSGITSVFHCAAMVSFRPHDKHKMIVDNPQITAYLVDAANRHGVAHFAYVSSVAAIGRSKEFSEIITEETEWKNGPENSNYAVSKYLAELEVWRGIEEGLPAAMVNPTIILGAGNWNNSSNAIFKRYAEGFPYFSEGKNGFVDVRDVVDALLKIHSENITRERYILVGKNWTYKKLATQMATTFGQKPPHKKPNKWLIGVLWRFEYLRSVLTAKAPLLTRETARSAQNQWEYSNEKAVKELGLTFRNIEESIDEFCGFYKNEKKS